MENLEVAIKMLCGRTTIIEVDSESPIEHVKVYLKSKMRIFVKSTGDKVIPVKVGSTQTIGSLKAMFLEIESTSANTGSLWFNDKKLDDSQTLAYYNIHEDSTLVFRPVGYLQICINYTSIGKTIILDVESSDKVGKIKKLIEELEGIPLDNQMLIFYEEELEDSCILADCNVQHESMLNLVLQPRKPFQIIVKVPGGKTVPVEVNHSHTVGEVKYKIENKIGFPVIQQTLIFGCKQLDNEWTVADYGIQKDSTLHLLRRMRAGPI